MAISHKYTCVLAVILLLSCFTGCTGKPPEAGVGAQSELEKLTFYSPYVQYLGKPLDELYPVLEESGEWGENLYNSDGSFPAWLIANQPVTVNGLDYYPQIMSNPIAFTPTPWAFDYETYLTTDDWDESIAQMKSVYDLLVSEMGEPEAMVNAQASLAQALEVGFESLDRQTKQEKQAWWILADDWTDTADSSHPERLLTCMMRVIVYENEIRINVRFALKSAYELGDLSRFAS